MSAEAQALEAQIQQIDAEENEELTEIKASGEAIAAAGTKFTELKALIEKQQSETLTEEQKEHLSMLLSEVGTHITEGTTQLTQHVSQLNEEAAGA